MLRVDNAGNVSKRFSSGTFPFSKFGGTCPLWNVHSTFDTPDRLLKQVIELPDGSRYFSIAQMVRRPVAPHPQPQPRFAIGLGCEIRHAARLVYATGIDLEKAEGTPIGVNCRLCERENCSQRAEPPITRTLILDENTRRVRSFASQCAGAVASCPGRGAARRPYGAVCCRAISGLRASSTHYGPGYLLPEETGSRFLRSSASQRATRCTRPGKTGWSVRISNSHPFVIPGRASSARTRNPDVLKR